MLGLAAARTLLLRNTHVGIMVYDAPWIGLLDLVASIRVEDTTTYLDLCTLAVYHSQCRLDVYT